MKPLKTRAVFPAIPVGGTAPQVEVVTINDGSDQRSKLTSLTVGFTSVVLIDAGAFTLVNRTTGNAVQLNVTSDDSTGKTMTTLTFVGSEIVAGSLADGNYLLTIDLDGDGETDAPDDYRFGADEADTFFRFFGDSYGDRDVDNLDYFQLRGAYGQTAGSSRYLWYFDYDGDGDVDYADVVQFQARYRRVLSLTA